MSQDKISVVVTAYNHEKYIQKALSGVLNQEGCPELEIIIGDDCSTDATLERIKEYDRKFPGAMNVLPREKNLGMLANLKDCFAHCTGNFIAIIEGDDYWTDNFKLKKQYEALKNDDDALFCFSNINLDLGERGGIISHLDDVKSRLQGRITIKELIEFGNPIGNFSCCMYKREALSYIPTKYFEYSGNADWVFHMYLLDKAHGIFLEDVCSVYRITENGAWSGKTNERKLMDIIELGCHYNKLFDHKYDSHFLNLFRNNGITSISGDVAVKKSGDRKNYLSIKMPLKGKKTFFFEIGRIKHKVESSS